MSQMTMIKQEVIRLGDGEKATLSTVHLPDGRYEVMLLNDFGDDIFREHAKSQLFALEIHKHLKKECHFEELGGKYKKLAYDLRDAAEYGVSVAGDDDGGACNFDSVTLALPGWHKSKVEQAAKEAGLRCFVWELWGSKSYVFSAPGGFQGNARTKVAEGMKSSLEGRGYEAGMYYQMD